MYFIAACAHCYSRRASFAYKIIDMYILVDVPTRCVQLNHYVFFARVDCIARQLPCQACGPLRGPRVEGLRSAGRFESTGRYQPLSSSSSGGAARC